MATALQLGKYTLLERIAVGGMAEVFRGKTHGAAGFEKDVALKRILSRFSADEDFVRMFIDEARIAAKLDHANIVQIYDFDLALVDDRQCFYIAMEWVDGKDLRQVLRESIRQNRPLSLSHCIFIAVEGLKGLHYAHTKTDGGKPLGIIHRDVSPHNLILSYTGAVKLSDFGIAKAEARATATSNGLIKGKLGYMSPEQVMGRPLDRRADVFSMGIVLYEMLTRTRLFAGESESQTIALVQGAVVPPMRERNPQIPPDVEPVVMTMLAANPDRRYPSAAEAARALSVTSLYSANAAATLGDYVARLFPNQSRATTSKTMSDTTRPPGEGGNTSQKTVMLEEAPAAAAAPPSTPDRPVTEQKTAMIDEGSPEQEKLAEQLAQASAMAAAKKAAKQSVVLPQGAPLPSSSAPTHAPVTEQKTAMIDGDAPGQAEVMAEVAAAARLAAQARSEKIAPPAAMSPASVAATSARRPSGAQAPVAAPPEQKTAIADAGSALQAKVMAQIAAAARAMPTPSSTTATPPARGGAVPEQKTAIFDAGPVSQVVSQVQGEAGKGAPPPSLTSAGFTPLHDGQRTVMLDAPAPIIPSRAMPSSAAALRPLPPPPPPPIMWPRWAAGIGIMVGVASVTAVASAYLLPKTTVVEVVTPELPPPPPPIPKTKIQLATTPPHASVTVDGRAWPHFTPTTIEGEVGKTAHIVVELEKYLPAERDLIFSENAKAVTIALEPEERAPLPQPKPEPKVVKIVKPKPTGVGVVSIFVRPWAVVYVDGVRKRQTPIASLEIPAGRHVIELVNESKGKRERVNVNIRPGINPEIRRDWEK